MEVIAYTDGSCLNNPGPGARSSIIGYDAMQTDISGGARHTTNNRMELMAVIRTIEYAILHHAGQMLHICLDSKYVQNGVIWLPWRKSKGRKTTARKPVANSDLWMTMDTLLPQVMIQRHRVKGHSDNQRNSAADHIAHTLACHIAQDPNRSDC